MAWEAARGAGRPRTADDANRRAARSHAGWRLDVATQTGSGALVEISSAEQARAGTCVVMARGRRVVASWRIDWQAASPTPVRDAVDRLVEEFQTFDEIVRFRFAAKDMELRFAAKDMELAAHAASALIEAAAHRGSARAYERVIETGMVVTYARPFLASNEAGLGKRWRPKDEAERALHEEFIDLRSEYHAHAAHTPQRQLEIMSGFSGSGPPILAESWTKLPVTKLRMLKEMATRQTARFAAEADRLYLELFGTRDSG